MQKNYFDVWRKNIPILIIFLIAGIILNWLRVSKEKGFFESSASIWIKAEPDERTTIREAFSFLGSQKAAGVEIDTHCQVIKSRLVLEDVVKILNLASDKKDEMEKMIRLIKSRITVAPIEYTKIIKITTRWDNPEMAVKIANSVAQAYISFTYREKQSGYDSVYNLQDEQVKLAKQKLMESNELAMRSVNEKVYLMMLEMREETRLNKAMVASGIQLFESASEAVFRGTRKHLKLFLGGVIGLVLGVSMIMLKEYLATPVWSDRQK